jgi:hypothetical protein
MGKSPLPSRGVLAIGGAAWRIADRAEYERTRAETAPTARGATRPQPCSPPRLRSGRSAVLGWDGTRTRASRGPFLAGH